MNVKSCRADRQPKNDGLYTLQLLTFSSTIPERWCSCFLNMKSPRFEREGCVFRVDYLPSTALSAAMRP